MELSGLNVTLNRKKANSMKNFNKGYNFKSKDYYKTSGHSVSLDKITIIHYYLIMILYILNQVLYFVL